MNTKQENRPSVPTTNTNTKGAVKMEAIVNTLKKGERVQIAITSKEMHGEELLVFAKETFGEAAKLSNHEAFGEKVFLDAKNLLGYSFMCSYRTGRVEGGEKFGIEVGSAAARIENTLSKVTAWVESSENGTKLVIKFSARQVAVEVLEEAVEFFIKKVEDAKATEVVEEDVEELAEVVIVVTDMTDFFGDFLRIKQEGGFLLTEVVIKGSAATLRIAVGKGVKEVAEEIEMLGVSGAVQAGIDHPWELNAENSEQVLEEISRLGLHGLNLNFEFEVIDDYEAAQGLLLERGICWSA